MLPILSLTFRYRAPEGFDAGPFPEAAWRGAFGYALKRAVCVMRLRPCAGCPLEFSCAYPFIFETRSGGEPPLPHEGDRAPHPYVLRAAPRDDPRSRDPVDLGVTLIGDAARHLPYVIHALDAAGRGGVGGARSTLILEAVLDAAGDPVWSPGRNLAPHEPVAPALELAEVERLAVTFLTPLRLVRDGEPVSAETLDGPTLAFAAARRIGLLQACFAGGAAGADFRSLKTQAQSVRILDRDLAWADRRRFSTRQRRSIVLGGVTGRLVLDVADAPAVAPYLEFCQFVHLGKSTTLGYGQIHVART